VNHCLRCHWVKVDHHNNTPEQRRLLSFEPGRLHHTSWDLFFSCQSTSIFRGNPLWQPVDRHLELDISVTHHSSL
jgi:hypothetical protein